MRFDILNPAGDSYTIDGLGSNGDLYAAAVVILLGEGYMGLRKADQYGEEAVVLPPFALEPARNDADEAKITRALGVWWNYKKRPGMPTDFFEWLRRSDVKRGVVDACDSVEISGTKRNVAVDLRAEACRLAVEIRGALHKR